jgi:hypothetical protein
MVALFSSDWGVTDEDDGGKSVWAAFEVESEA